MLDMTEQSEETDVPDMDSNDLLTASLILISILTGTVASIMKVYCAISLGQLFRNHRILISIGFYFAIYFSLQMISMFLSVGGIILVQGDSLSQSYYNFTYTLSILENIAVSVAGFWVTIFIMKKHLNVI